MSRIASLRQATSLGDLASLLGFSPKGLSYVVYKIPDNEKYRTFSIPKRSGGRRTIEAPVQGLKLAQQRLSQLLQDCVEEVNDTRGRADRMAHGFKRERSILTNAALHRHRRLVFNLDLKDFFPSINFGRVRGYFLKNRDFELDESVATLIAQIACHKNSLPQGSPSSPVLSNLVAHILDMRLVGLAAAEGCFYSRYADDLTFSTNKRVMPHAIAVRPDGAREGSHVWEVGSKLRRIIERSGFSINSAKTCLMYRDSRQQVTGLVVNDRVGVKQEYHHKARAMVHRLITTGQFERLGVVEKDGSRSLENRPGTLNELHGILGFIDSVQIHSNPRDSPRKWTAAEKTYRTFPMYSTFYAAPTPVIVCEGKTDGVYLTHAIRSLATDFPVLADVATDGKIQLRVRILKYSRSSTGELLGLRNGGAGNLGHFIRGYVKEGKRFTAPGSHQPAIVLYDNDSGADSVHSAIKSACNASDLKNRDFVKVFKNLYAVPTPLKNGTSSMIEDFFDDATKSIKINGKTFHPGKKGFDETKHYDKVIFAHKVVRANADKINFDGFKPLLSRLQAVVAHNSPSA